MTDRELPVLAFTGPAMRGFNVKMDGQLAVLAVAQKGSYSAAGKLLSVTKSTVQKQVQSVNTELTTPVFQFLGKRMVPTKAGEIYLPEVRESVRHARLGVERVRSFVRAQAKDLRIGYSSHLSEALLNIIDHLHLDDTTPLERESLLTRDVVAGVLEGKFHVGFGYLPIGEPSFAVRTLLQEPLMVCLPRRHRLEDKQTIEPADLTDEPIVALARKALPGRHEAIVKYFEGEGVFLKFVADAYLPKEALWQVIRGTGLALMARSAAASMRYDVVLRPLADEPLMVKSGVFTRSDSNAGFIKEFMQIAWNATAGLRPKPSKPKSPETP